MTDIVQILRQHKRGPIGGPYLRKAADEIERLRRDQSRACELCEANAREVERLREWRRVALRLGESLVDVGPEGYYSLTPDEWLAWAQRYLRATNQPAGMLEWVCKQCGQTNETERDRCAECTTVKSAASDKG